MPRRARGRRIDGILLVDKPDGETSNRTLQRVRGLYRARKAGHTGTLDPFATGLLPLCFGEATKFGTGLLDGDKSYRVTARWGSTTDTGDIEGEITGRSTAPVPAADRIETVLAEHFTGPVEQIPPMYSALKHEGRRLHEIARAGGDVERPARTVRIHRVRLDNRDEAGFSLSVCCSKGTYIRVLVEDLAAALGGLAHCVALRRTAVGPFSVEDACTPDVLESLDEVDLQERLLPVDAALEALAVLDLALAERRAAIHGNPIRTPAAAGLAPGVFVRLYDGERFLGVGEVMDDAVVAPRRLVAELSEG